jgi:hypothetical protein
MKKSRVYRLNKFIGQLVTGGKCPEIRWDSIVRIEAFGTEVVSAFAIVIIFHYADGSESHVHPEQKGYYEIIEALDRHFPSIPPDWFEKIKALGKEPFDVEQVLYVCPTVEALK